MHADLSAVQHLGADRANIDAAFDWAATHDQWVIAAELLLGAFTVFDASPSEGIELVVRCVDALPDTEHDLAARMVCNKWPLHVVAADYRPLMTSARGS